VDWVKERKIHKETAAVLMGDWGVFVFGGCRENNSFGISGK